MRIKKIIIFILPIILILISWKNVLLNISTHLYSWYDGPFVIYLFQNNMRHFSSLDFAHLFETNAMYPFSFSLSFTEHMFFPSLLVWIISFISNNPIFQFNVLAILNHLLLYICFFLLAGRFTKNIFIRVLVSFFTAFSPYFFSQIGHLQMVFFWPFLLSMYYISHPKRRLVHVGLAGLWLGLQFLSAVYLGLMGFGIIALYYLLNRPKEPSKIIRETGIFLAAFFLVSLPSIIGYLLMQRMYKPTYEQSQYVTYAAHLSDYLFVFFNNSVINISLLRPIIGVFNRHVRGEMAGFVGVIPIVVGCWSLVVSKSMKKNFRENRTLFLWIFLLIVIGIVFSLGPRMNWNGTYLVTPLPYWFIMKVPVIGVMRAVARWYFLVIFALSIMLIFGLDTIFGSIKNKLFKSLFFPLIFILLILEIYPTPVEVSARNWKSSSYIFLQNACKDKPGAVLEYPFEYRYKSEDIGKYLSLKTNILLSSTLHNCPTLSGYSAFEPELFKKWQTDFDTNGITDSNIKILKENKFVFIKVNLEALSREERLDKSLYIHTKEIEEIYRGKESAIYKIK